MIEFEKLVKIYPFNKLKKNDLNQLLLHCKFMHFRKGKYITYEGDRLVNIYFIIEGTVKLYKWMTDDKKRFIKDKIMGQWISISESIINSNHYFDAKANSNVICLEIPIETINKMIENPIINKSILVSLADWNKDYNKILINKTCLDTLKKFIKEFEHNEIEITQEQLSNNLGYSRESINKNLKKIEDLGIIKIERSKIIKL